MRHHTALLVAALCAAAPAVSAAAPVEEGTVEISGTVGLATPFGDLGDFLTSGFSIGGAFGYFVSPTNSLGVSIVYNDFGVDDDAEEEGLDGDYAITEIAGTWKALFGRGGNPQPYGRAVIGVFRSTASVSSEFFGVDFDVSASSSDLGIGAGLGLQMRGRGRAGGFVEAMVVSVFTEGDTSNYLGLRAGLSFFLAPGR